MYDYISTLHKEKEVVMSFFDIDTETIVFKFENGYGAEIIRNIDIKTYDDPTEIYNSFVLKTIKFTEDLNYKATCDIPLFERKRPYLSEPLIRKYLSIIKDFNKFGDGGVYIGPKYKTHYHVF